MYRYISLPQQIFQLLSKWYICLADARPQPAISLKLNPDQVECPAGCTSVLALTSVLHPSRERAVVWLSGIFKTGSCMLFINLFYFDRWNYHNQSSLEDYSNISLVASFFTIFSFKFFSTLKLCNPRNDPSCIANLPTAETPFPLVPFDQLYCTIYIESQ